MLNGDGRRLELAYSLMFTLPGTPVIRYGDEIGMGDNLDLQERVAARTPMQWSTEPRGGFTKNDRPVVPAGRVGASSRDRRATRARRARRVVAQAHRARAG